MNLSSVLNQCAQQVGFPLTGVVDLELAYSHPSQAWKGAVKNYGQWIDDGHAGTMEYLVRGKARKADPRLVFPESKSILCVALPYSALPNYPLEVSGTLPLGPQYARYLRGKDYHLLVAEMLEEVMRKAKQEWEEANPNQPLRWKVCVDTSAVMERTWAALTGLGWIGKNSMLIHPQYGSYLYLGEVLINQETGVHPKLLPNYCGSCQRCKKACPTDALIEPGFLNTKKCISYWTLEKRGEIEEDSTSPTTRTDTRSSWGSWVAGCDICQEVCPFNLKAVKASVLEQDKMPEALPTVLTWEEHLREDFAGYKNRIKESSLSRIKPADFSRNLAIALTNAVNAASKNVDGQLASFKNLLPLVEHRLMSEENPVAKKEWEICFTTLNSQIGAQKEQSEPGLH